jgi:integrase
MKALRAGRKRKFIEAAIIRKLLKGAGDPLKAMILLGINGGLGNRDVAALKLSQVDSKSEWLDYPREKTGAARRIWLWKETRKALDDARKARPDSELPNFFITRFGRVWGWETANGKNDEVGKQFFKLVRSLKLSAPGVSFYSLRHTFRTVADNATRDRRAIELVMGHAGNPEDMGTHYVEHIDDARVMAVADAVHSWLFAKSSREKKKLKV